MTMYVKVFTMCVLLSSTFVPYGLAQNSTGDFCQRHANLWENDGSITLEGHQKLHLENRGWWFNSNTKEWKEWPAQETQWSLDEYKDVYLDGPEWWVDSAKGEWEEWPKDQRESLECHKKMYLSGPQWWFDSSTKKWKRWPK